MRIENENNNGSATPFQLNGALGLPNGRFGSVVERAIEKGLGLSCLDQMYRALEPDTRGAQFADQSLAALGIGVDVEAGELSRIPASGPVVVVANHPFGALEGLVLASVLPRVRPDIRLLVNWLLMRIPELNEMFVAVDPFGASSSVQKNATALRRATGWVKNGGLLATFPAGEVSHARLSTLCVTDPAWSNSAAGIVRHARATVVPLYFAGANSTLFQILGLLHPRLRTAMLPRELVNKQHSVVRLRVGTPVPWSSLGTLPDDTAVCDYLRLRTYLLGRTGQPRKAPARHRGKTTGEPVAPARPAASLSDEVAALPDSARLGASGQLDVYLADAPVIPNVLNEIGRLREITFRAAGEGSGEAVDIDRYDAAYQHLFLWHRTAREVVGAYRLGRTDQIIRLHGKKGLYTHSLFAYKQPVLDRLSPALELGRAFVRDEYQRSFAPLMLLWKGIGQFVASHPHYSTLFGPVSLSNDYATLSQQLMVGFLKRDRLEKKLAAMVRPRNPFKTRQRIPTAGLTLDRIADIDIEVLSTLLADIEADHKGVPILLKQYLRLGGRVLGFNVDTAFGNAIDVLVMVDLKKTSPRVLERYMGREQAHRFLGQSGAITAPDPG